LERETAEIDFGVGDLCAWVWSIMGARAAVKQTQRIDTVIFHSILKFLSTGVVNLHLWVYFCFADITASGIWLDYGVPVH